VLALGGVPWPREGLLPLARRLIAGRPTTCGDVLVGIALCGASQHAKAEYIDDGQPQHLSVYLPKGAMTPTRFSMGTAATAARSRGSICRRTPGPAKRYWRPVAGPVTTNLVLPMYSKVIHALGGEAVGVDACAALEGW
jgi:hypothetical protein